MTLRAALKAVQEGKCFVYSPPTYCKFDQVDSIIWRKIFCSGRYKARPCIQLNIGFRKILMALERRLRPDEEPSIKLKLTSRKPVLSSSRRPQKTKDVAKASESWKIMLCGPHTFHSYFCMKPLDSILVPVYFIILPPFTKKKGALALDVINLGANVHDIPRSQVANFSFVKNFIIIRGRTLRALLSVSEGTWK